MDIFIARQGIYDKNGKIIAYELLYRNSLKNNYSPLVEDEIATYKVIENISSFGLDVLTNKKRAFVNFSEELIKKDIATLLPKENVVIELLESVRPSIEIIERLSILKESGYIIALDDVIDPSYIVHFIGLVDIVKIDFILSTKESRKKIASLCHKFNIKILAEKIETEDDLIEAKELECDFFQGYYYSKPAVFLGKDVSIKNTSIFMLLVELIKENYDIDKVEYIMKTDIALTYKFLRFINSSYFSFLQEIKSIKQSIVLIGRKELRKWLSILSVVEMSSINDGYAQSIIIRAKFCEEIAKEIKFKDESAAFMVGLFSNIHNMIEQEIDYVVEELPLNIEIKKALLGEQNILRDILDLALAYEKIDSDLIDRIRKKMNISEGLLWRLYSKSIEWSSNIDN